MNLLHSKVIKELRRQLFLYTEMFSNRVDINSLGSQKRKSCTSNYLKNKESIF